MFYFIRITVIMGSFSNNRILTTKYVKYMVDRQPYQGKMLQKMSMQVPNLRVSQSINEIILEKEIEAKENKYSEMWANRRSCMAAVW